MARSPSTRWYSALAALIVFVLLAWLLGAVLALTDGERVTLRVGLVALGLIAACLLLWYLRPQEEQPAAPPSDKGGPDVLAAVTAARARLPRGVFNSRAMVLVLGPEGSCKTTLVSQSGLDPEILASDAGARGRDAPIPTGAGNFWLVKDAVLAEAGAAAFTDAALWRKLIRALRAPRFAAAFGRGQSAPRSAVVCVSCDLFFGGNAHAQMEGLAQVTRQRLTQAAREFGVALPVYVVFTKADRLPNFEAWVAPLTNDEVRAPVGAALPFDESAGGGAARARAAGTYADRIVPRLEAAFARVTSALAQRRVDLLGRESVGEKRLQAYELPRELGKLTQEATRFLLEICRPMQLGVSPQLRGFYFVGARPIVVTDQAPPSTAAAKASSSAKLSASDATAVFVSAASPDAEAKLPDAPVRATSRRVPQWVFLDRIFPDVVLADVGAAAMARGGTRVAHVRRALLGAGIAAALFVSVGVLRSWLGNRSLAQRTAVAARDVAALPVVTTAAGTMAFPSADALRRLDALRTVLDTLHAYTTSAVPNRLQWGLWQGNALLSPGRRVWLEGYRRQLHASAYGALVDSLRALPVSPRPSDEYGQDYGMLKAYLIMTSESPRSTPDFLAPVLLSSWTRGQPVDADVLALARRQFEFYALGLALENPWPQAADARLVNHTRDFLNRFTGGEQIYLYMLAQADKVVQPVRFAESVPQASGVVTALPEVQGAFTRPGWEFMENAFRNSDRFFEGEQWVVGDATARQTEDRDAILAQLRARYRNEYLQRWRGFVRSAAVARPVGNREAGARDAARRLGIVGGAQSPLLATLSLVARNTAVDSGVAAAFQPVHTVTPPEATDKYVNDGNQQYVSALVGLQGALEQVTYLPPAVDTPSTQAIQQAAQQALGQVTQAKLAARQLAQKFAVDTAAAQVGPAVAVLLESPINGAEGVLRALVGLRPPSSRPAVVAPPAGGGGGGAPPAPPPGGGGGASRAAAELAAILNERGAAICSAMTPMLAKFPFNPDASAEATVAEVVGLLAPGTGQLPAFQQERLADLMEKQGGQWVAKGGGLVALSAPFISFFNRASQVSAALFGAGSTPRVVFHAHGIATPQMPNVTLLHGTNMARFNQSSVPAQFVWPAPSGREARLIAQFGREKEREIAKTTGEWALFRLVAQSTKTDVTGPAEFRSQWNATGKGAVPVDVVFRFESGMPVAQRGWLGGMSCISQVTR